MRPTIVRPDVAAIGRYFDQQLDLLKEKDKTSYEEGKQLKRLMIGGYLNLIYMQCDMSYSEWAGYMMVAVAKCGGLVLKMNLMRHTFDLIYSLYCGFAGDTLGRDERLKKYKSKYGSSKTTYKDANDIATDFSNSWGELNDIYLGWKCEMDTRDIVAMIEAINLPECGFDGPPELERPELDPATLATENYIISYLWKAALTTYARLKYYGLDLWDYDVVFQNQSPPFPACVFFDLLNRYEQYCGWMPVGNVGLFDTACVTEDLVKESSMGLHCHISGCGIPRARSCTWSREFLEGRMDHHRGVAEPRLKEGKLYVSDVADFDPVNEFTEMNEIKSLGTKYNPEIAEYIANSFYDYRVMDPHLFTSNADRYIGMTLFNADDEDEDLIRDLEETRLYGAQDFLKLIKSDFNGIKTCIVKRKFEKPAEIPFLGDIKRLQQIKEFGFFKEILTSGPENVRGGLFVQACIDYANNFDPLVPDPNKDAWVEWTVIDMSGNEGMLINDKKLFIPGTLVENSVHDAHIEQLYKVRAEGSVCYGYNCYGQALVAPALYCEGCPYNALSATSYNLIREAVKKDPVTSIVRLPLLTLSEHTMAMVWRGRELPNLDISYWHKALGHVSLRALKRYMRIIKGMPPYFWPYTIYCDECFKCEKGESS
ncbi:YALIA101S08e04698g1_1 [Yarrowia lipolytica]|nr:Hypothetical protein YALI2_A00109g [Yarrowia lipolytica]SEI35827.1 YALIA101S08e04698g1_1 [Yarrowia lipolytica]